ncbi:hypothetical protein MSG28_008279 [Choristoneura fumiferana]|uniref:Uncharacterized protein n=1 Tax=Choristoneura fumiferana TaxID=7141 RepID=A0ACC0JAZ2_CHOFU|nr:hypothetical protein MSG28_008279 [Choristoneura fumiferana]
MSYNYEDLSIGEIKDLLRQWRESNERRSKDVMELWDFILVDIHKLGNEKYVILEQVLYAALDTHRYNVSLMCISILSQEFPGSMRVMRYKAAQLEAEEKLEYGRAAFCAEELLLHQPHNHLLQQRLADIRYTMGGVENMELAKTYYCQALKLNPDNMRALLGLFLVTNNLLNHYKSAGNSSKRAEVWKLCQFAQSQTAKKQKEARETSASPSLSNMMLALAITE